MVPTESCFYFRTPILNPASIRVPYYNRQMVITAYDSFFSCSHYSRGVSFSLYLAPYDTMFWMVLIFMLLLSACNVSLGFYLLNKEFHPVKIFVYFCGLLMDEVDQLPNILSNFLPLRCISVPWVLVSTVIINCYLGSVITNLNAPLPGERYDTYEKITCSEKSKISINYDMIENRKVAMVGNYNGMGFSTYLRNSVGFCYTFLSEFVRDEKDNNTFWKYNFRFINYFYGINDR